jgi:polygalacturonase
MENCDIRSPFKPVPAPSTDGVDSDACKKVTIRKCYISVNDDAVCLKGGKGPDAHLRDENGIVEDILVEDCDFGDSHGTLTLGSECIHARNVTVRNCKVDNSNPILRLKMRPDTYQVYEDIHIENITGRSGTLISMAPWRQFFDLGGSKEKPFAIVRNITFSNIKVNTKNIGEIVGNPNDKVSKIVFKDSDVTAASPALINKNPDVKFVNFKVNGTPFVPK